MKKLQYWLDLQLFGDGGGDGGAAAGSTGTAAVSGDMGGTEGQKAALPHKIPEKYRNIYEKAQKRTKGRVDAPTRTDELAAKGEAPPITTEEEGVPEPPKKLTYRELIESEDYKPDHERFIQKTLKDRTKKYDAELARVNDLLTLAGQRYGLDPNAETFRDDLEKALRSDDSLYEKYAEEHDVSLPEARRMVGLEQQLEKAQKESEARKEAEENAARIQALRESAEKTKAIYPNFDLDREMQNPMFVRQCAVWGGNTTAAFRAVHHDEILGGAVRQATESATQAVVNRVKANRERPTEGDLSSSHTQESLPDFKAMNLSQLRAFADEQRRRRNGR